LREPDACVVERLEDAMDVVGRLGADDHEGEPLRHHTLDAADLDQILSAGDPYEGLTEPEVGSTDSVIVPDARPTVYTSLVSSSIGLGGHDFVSQIAVVLVDEEQIVDAIPLFGLALGQVVPKCAQKNRQRGEPLLAIDDQPLLHPGWSHGRARSKDE
jgi:hypothetical protein